MDTALALMLGGILAFALACYLHARFRAWVESRQVEKEYRRIEVENRWAVRMMGQ